MAKNAGEGERKGPVSGGTEKKTPDGDAIERNMESGQIVDRTTPEGDPQGADREGRERRVEESIAAFRSVLSVVHEAKPKARKKGDPYASILKQLDRLPAGQLQRLMGEIQARLGPPTKYRLEDFMVPRPGVRGTGEDWVGALRAEWDDRG